MECKTKNSVIPLYTSIEDVDFSDETRDFLRYATTGTIGSVYDVFNRFRDVKPINCRDDIFKEIVDKMRSFGYKNFCA